MKSHNRRFRVGVYSILISVHFQQDHSSLRTKNSERKKRFHSFINLIENLSYLNFVVECNKPQTNQSFNALEFLTIYAIQNKSNYLFIFVIVVLSRNIFH